MFCRIEFCGFLFRNPDIPCRRLFETRFFVRFRYSERFYVRTRLRRFYNAYKRTFVSDKKQYGRNRRNSELLLHDGVYNRSVGYLLLSQRA